MSASHLRKAVTIFVPDGYADAADFLKDCAFEQAAPSNNVEFIDPISRSALLKALRRKRDDYFNEHFVQDPDTGTWEASSAKEEALEEMDEHIEFIDNFPAASIDEAMAEKNLATLKASTLLIIAEKIAPVIDEEIEQRKAGCNPDDWACLQSLSDELHAAMRLVRG